MGFVITWNAADDGARADIVGERYDNPSSDTVSRSTLPRSASRGTIGRFVPCAIWFSEYSDSMHSVGLVYGKSDPNSSLSITPYWWVRTSALYACHGRFSSPDTSAYT